MVRKNRSFSPTSLQFLRLCGFCLACGLLATPADAQQRGGRRGFGSPEEIFSRLDQNGDGKLESDEVQGPMKAFLQNAGTDTSKAMSRDEFVKTIQDLQQRAISGRRGEDRRRDEGDDGERRRRRRDDGDDDDEEAGDRPRGRSGRWNWNRSGDEPAAAGSSEETSGDKSADKDAKPRVTLDLPEEYRAGDANGDGQVTFFEWRRWNGRRFSEFVAMDRNGDGFLTPKEIVVATSSPETGEEPTVQTADRGDNSAVGGDPPQAETSAPPVDETELAVNARRYFGILDRDRDGKISPVEWAPSRRIREMFESAGVDLSSEMSEADFVQNYVKFASQAS